MTPNLVAQTLVAQIFIATLMTSDEFDEFDEFDDQAVSGVAALVVSALSHTRLNFLQMILLG